MSYTEIILLGFIVNMIVIILLMFYMFYIGQKTDPMFVIKFTNKVSSRKLSFYDFLPFSRILTFFIFMFTYQKYLDDYENFLIDFYQKYF